MRAARIALMVFVPFLMATVAASAQPKAGDDALGSRKYDDYERPQACATCHVDIARQHEQAMMSQAYTHHWDEIEYFELAVPHAAKEPKVAGRQGRVQRLPRAARLPGRRRAAAAPGGRDSRANESVSCDLCHTITGFVGDTPFNFNWISEPGKREAGHPRRASRAPTTRSRRTRSCARPSSAAPATTRRTRGACS